MPSTTSSITTIFCITLILAIPQLSHQYTYLCNATASCGCSSNPASINRIVGGEAAGMSTWGWAVGISINGNGFCGGAVLSNSWIITGAHCVSDVSASQVIVYAGSNNISSGQSIVASRIIVHPSYRSNTFENDIALIQLITPLTMSNSVKIICIPSVSLATLAAGEWPPANLYVCFPITFLLLVINIDCLYTGCRCWMGPIVRGWFFIIVTSTSDSSNNGL